MSQIRKPKAVVIAEHIKDALEPHCELIEIAGSIRRGKQAPGDIDIVLIWKNAGLGLVNFYRGHRTAITRPTGGARIIKFEWLQPFIKVQLFQTDLAGWPSELLIRTGSAEHNIKMCTVALKKGLKLSVGAGLLDGSGHPIAGIETERDIFTALGVPYAEPHERGK